MSLFGRYSRLLLSVNITDHSKSKRVNSACIGLGVVLVMNQFVVFFITFFCIYINSLLELRKEMKFVCLCRCLTSKSTIFR